MNGLVSDLVECDSLWSIMCSTLRVCAEGLIVMSSRAHLVLFGRASSGLIGLAEVELRAL